MWYFMDNLLQGLNLQPLDYLLSLLKKQINASEAVSDVSTLQSFEWVWKQTEPKVTGGYLTGQRSTGFSDKPVYSAQAPI